MPCVRLAIGGIPAAHPTSEHIFQTQTSSLERESGLWDFSQTMSNLNRAPNNNNNNNNNIYNFCVVRFSQKIFYLLVKY
jgi:hypothetical protein